MSLRADNVCYAVGAGRVLENIALTVVTGEILALVGLNGSGKSTLLSLLAGCPLPNSGEVTLETRPLADWSMAEVAMRRAILPQAPTLAFDFPVLEMVKLGAIPHRVSGDELEYNLREVIRWMDLAHLAERRCFSLSGGELQRVHLARVLLQINLQPSLPRYLLLDEPLAALDIAHQYALMERLRQLISAPRSIGIGVVLVTHDLNVALNYADRVCLLRAGRCRAIGPTAKVMTADQIREVFGVNAAFSEPSGGTRWVATYPVESA